MTVNRDDYAIVIGIDTYSRLYRLRSAHADASAFARWLTSADGGGLPEQNVHLFLGPERPLHWADEMARPLQRHIDISLAKIGIERNTRIGRRLYFYFAGHGFGPRIDDVAMLMIDASETKLNSNISLRHYRDFFKKHHLFDEIIFVLDCCRDPAPPGISGVQMGAPSFTLVDRRGDVQDYVVLAAAYGEKAYAVASEDVGQRRGLLTRAVLEGLERAHDGLGRVTSASLRDYIMMRVPKLAEESQEFDIKLRNQRPEISSLPNPPIVFTTVSADDLPRLCVHVIAGAGQNGLLTLYDGTARKLDQIAASNATAEEPWELELPRNNLVYVVEHSVTQEQIPILPQAVMQEPHIISF